LTHSRVETPNCSGGVGLKQIVGHSGHWIRELREQRGLKPKDIENITQVIARRKRNPDFYLSHGTLAGIESGSTPTIHKLYSLAAALGVSMGEMLIPFGIDLYKVERFSGDAAPRTGPPFRYQLHFDRMQLHEATEMKNLTPEDVEGLPPIVRSHIDLDRYRYAQIGPEDDTMADLIPPKSVVEIDTEQKAVRIFAWRTLAERPIYMVWHGSGHTCCWCQVEGQNLILIPHPLSQKPVRQFKLPREATVIGKVTSAWLPFSSERLQSF